MITFSTHFKGRADKFAHRYMRKIEVLKIASRSVASIIG